MSARKPAVAKVAAKPAARAKPAPAKAATPAASANGAATQDTSDAATRLARDIDRALNEGRTDLLSEEALQALMAAVCRSYSAQIEAGGRFPPLANRSRVTSTDVMVTASGLLKAANLAVFELGMWQSWTGR
jgi:outer membrane biosynthesis protein TonB